MSLLLIPSKPPTDVHAKLLNISDAEEAFKESNAEKLIYTLGEILVKYQINKQFGICLVHKHFPIAANEILVECINEDDTLSVSFPWIYNNGRCSPLNYSEVMLHNLEDDIKKPFVVPSSWCFTKDGNLLPYEYLVTNDSSSISPPESCVQEIFTILFRNKIVDIIGLRLLNSSRKQNAWEITPKDVRANILTIGEMPTSFNKDDMIRVLWAFSDEKKLSENSAFCCDYCTHCYKCHHV